MSECGYVEGASRAQRKSLKAAKKMSYWIMHELKLEYRIGACHWSIVGRKKAFRAEKTA